MTETTGHHHRNGHQTARTTFAPADRFARFQIGGGVDASALSFASLAFDAQGHHLASAGGDKTVDVWGLERIRQEFAKLGLAW